MSRKLWSGFLIVYLMLAVAAPVIGWAQDPSGANTGTAADVPAATPGAPTNGGTG